MKERRENSRTDFSDIITYEAGVSLVKDVKSDQLRGEGQAVDISKGGICLVTKEELSKNQILKINIPMPGMSVQTPALAMVRWTRPHQDGYKVGMMFVI